MWEMYAKTTILKSNYIYKAVLFPPHHNRLQFAVVQTLNFWSALFHWENSQVFAKGKWVQGGLKMVVLLQKPAQPIINLKINLKYYNKA